MTTQWQSQSPTRAEIDAGRGPLLLEFGSPTCGHCLAAQPWVEQALADQGPLPHLKVIDGPGRPLGRSFGVKLWPTLVFLRDGQELVRLVRPRELAPLRAALAQVLDPG
jgi:thioredoxin 1